MSFDTLKEGDKVILQRSMQILTGGWRSGLNRDVFQEATVEKVTATQFTADGLRFMRRNGSQVGGDQAVAHLPGRPVSGGGLAVVTPDNVINGWLLIRGALGDTQRRLQKLEAKRGELLKEIAKRADTPEQISVELERLKAFNQALSDLLQDGSF
ncbi:MAG: hypothetical protein E7H74_18485 [Escherichia coli]|nr:hypothetical protein [Escherichia coli]